MPRYLRENGQRTASNDAKRQVWYGVCTYWTDDWDNISTVDVIEIPHCPHCGSPGFQTDAFSWFGGASEYDKTNSGYLKFLVGMKETCHGRGVTLQSLYDAQGSEQSQNPTADLKPLQLIKEAVTEHFGEKCPDQEENCFVCHAWQEIAECEKALDICQTCHEAKGQPRVDNTLPSGTHCQACWDKLVDDARKQSW